MTVFEGDDHHLRRDGRRGRPRWPAGCRAGRRARRRRRPALLQLPRVPRDDLRRQPPRRHRHADQLAARRRPRCATSSSTPRPRALVCDDDARRRWPTRRPRASRTRSSGPASSTPAPDGWTALADLRAGDATVAPRCAAAADDVHRLMYTSGTTGRPKGVMLTHANLAWKNLAHIVEFGFTGDDLGLACGPLYHVGALDLTTTTLIAAGATVDHPPHVRRRRGGRRARALAGHHRVAGARDGQRDHGAARHRAARPVVGAGDHQRRREDADPAHRADPAHVPVGVVRRRLRPHRDGLRRHVPRPRQPRHQARQRRPARACTSSSTSGTSEGRSVAAGRAGRDRAAGPEGVQGLLARPRGHRRRRSPAAGSTPATSACATRTATCSSSTGSRT